MVAIEVCCDRRLARSESTLGLYMPKKAKIRPQSDQKAFLCDSTDDRRLGRILRPEFVQKILTVLLCDQAPGKP